MGESTRGRWAGRIPGGLLGMLALLLAAETFLRAHRLDFAQTWSEDWRHAAAVAATGLRDRDVLVLGDSLVKYGVLPREIETRTGLKSYNLALNAGQTPATYFLLRRALEAGARPRAIVADFLGLMKPDLDRRTEAYAALATVGDVLDLGRTARQPDLAAQVLLGQLSLAIRNRFEIRRALLGGLGGYRTSAWPAQAIVWRTWDDQGGAQPMPFMPWRFGYDGPLHQSLILPGWRPDPTDVAYIDRTLALAESRGIPVFWLIPPLSPQVSTARRAVGTDEAYDRLVRSLLARHPGVEVIDARDSGYDDTAHIDLMHLEYRGARVLSADLADLLADRLLAHQPPPLDRRLALPAFANRTGDEPARTLARRLDAPLRR